MIYRAIGKAVVRYGVLYMRRRHRRAIRITAATAAVALGVAAYLVTRNVPEG